MKPRRLQMKLKVVVLSQKILWLSVLSLLCAVAEGAQIAPLPTSQENISYEPVEYPTPSLQAAYSKPIGVGSVAGTGDYVAIQVVLPQFSGTVDVYVALYAPSLNPEPFLLKPDYSLAPLSSGLTKWKDNVNAPIEESIYGSIPVKNLPQGTYYVYLGITPHDDLSRYTLYGTSFVIPPSKMAPPTGQEVFPTQGMALPIVHTIAGKASPIGLGSVVTGGDDLTLRIGLSGFSSPVDVYLATYWPAVDPVNFYLVDGQNQLSPLSSGLVKWKENYTGPISEIVMSLASMAALPPGVYTFYLAVTPAGSTEYFYFWSAEVSSTTLVVDSFGNGTVTSNIGGINCGDKCAASYQPGTTVALTATPDADSVFQSWEGCDTMPGWTPNSKTCYVTISTNRTVQPTFVLKETKLDPSVRILDAAALNLLIRQEGTVYYFDPEIRNMVPLSEGDIIISTIVEQTKDAVDNARTGFIRRIVSITPSQKELKIETEDATLEDAVIEGTFLAAAEDLQIDQAAIQLESGVRIVDVRRVAGKPELELEINKVIDNLAPTVRHSDADGEGTVVIGGKATLTGRITLSFEPDFGLHIGCCRSLIFPYVKDFRAILKTTNTNDLSVSVTGAFQGEGRVKILEKPFKPVVVGCCLVVVPKFNLYLGVEGNADAGVTAGVTVETSLKAGVKYKRNKGWSPVGETTNHSDFQPPTVFADASLKGFLSPEFAFLLYGAGGPFVNAKGYLKMEAWSPPLSWLLSAGIEGCVGAEVKILGKGLRSPEWCPVGHEWPLKRGGSAGGTLQVEPAEGFSSSGPIGGPFSPAKKVYTLKNTGHAPIEWSASGSEWWVEVERNDIIIGFQKVSSLVRNAAVESVATGGKLEPGDSVNVTVSVSPVDVSTGAHTASVNFINLTNGDGNTSREVSLSVTAGYAPPVATIQ